MNSRLFIKGLQGNPHTELDMPRSALTEYRVARIRCAPRETESSGGAAGWIRTWSSKVRMVEQIEKLRPEFDPGYFSKTPCLRDRHVHVLESRSPEKVAACVAIRSVGRRGQHTVASDVTPAVFQRSTSEPLLRRVAD